MCVIARDKNNDILAILNSILRKCGITFSNVEDRRM